MRAVIARRYCPTRTGVCGFTLNSNILKWNVRLTLVAADVVPPFLADDDNPSAERWGPNGIRAAPLFASLVGIGYRALHDGFLHERVNWIREQNRAGVGHQVLAPNLEQTVILQRDCLRAIQKAERWTRRLSGSRLGAIKAGPGSTRMLEIDLRARHIKIAGSISDIGAGHELYLLAALAETPGQLQPVGAVVEMMRRLGYRHRTKDAVFNVRVSKHRLLRVLKIAAERADVNVAAWIESLDDRAMRLCLASDEVRVYRPPLLAGKR